MAVFVENNKSIRTVNGINNFNCRESGCSNWNGNCAYDIEMEAKSIGCSVCAIVNKDRCKYYEPPERD